MTDAVDLRETLGPKVAAALGVAKVTMTSALGGAANRSFVITDPAAPDKGPLAFMRCAPPDGGINAMGYTLIREADVLRVAAKLGFPVATVLATFDDPPSMLMNMVPGTDRPDAAQIEAVGPKYMALIAAVHAADSTAFPVRQFDTVQAAVAAELQLWKGNTIAGGGYAEPLIVLSMRVLEEHIPTDTAPPVLVHGDVGAGNFMCEHGEVTAMIDWELAHLSDPHEDLAWCWMRGAHTSFGDPRQRIAEYQAAAGRDIDPALLDWFLAFVMWKSTSTMHSRLAEPIHGQLSMIQMVVRLTYDALLGSQTVRVLGGSLPLLTEPPQRSPGLEVTLADEMLSVADLPADQRIVVEYLRDSAAQAPWQRRGLERDCHDLLGIAADDLNAFVVECPSNRLLDAAIVVGRHADRRAQAMPKAVRRIQRAKGIGLGTAT
jgi:aminoglycoside phosphotransferase (APT) family kinase protein